MDDLSSVEISIAGGVEEIVRVQTVFPAICNIDSEEGLADYADAQVSLQQNGRRTR